MKNSQKARLQAKEILLQYGITKPTLDNLVFIITRQGFEIIDYDPREAALLQELAAGLNVADLIQMGKTFTYKNRNVKLVFVNDQLNADEKKYALAHELGHIACEHLSNGSCSESSIKQEHEANEFAHYILYAPVTTKIHITFAQNKRLVLSLSVCLVVLLLAIPIVCHIVKVQSYYGEYYVTENGEKYHKGNCIFIKDKKNVERLTEKQYYAGEYEPCQICLPNK